MLTVHKGPSLSFGREKQEDARTPSMPDSVRARHKWGIRLGIDLFQKPESNEVEREIVAVPREHHTRDPGGGVAAW